MSMKKGMLDLPKLNPPKFSGGHRGGPHFSGGHHHGPHFGGSYHHGPHFGGGHHHHHRYHGGRGDWSWGGVILALIFFAFMFLLVFLSETNMTLSELVIKLFS